MNRLVLVAIAPLMAALGACGPSASELRLTHEADELHKDIAEQKQYIADLKLRIQMVDARNRVLIDLVQGFTGQTNAQLASNVPVAAHASLQALDRDLEALIASVQHSREDIDALRAQRQALTDQLAQAKHIIEDSQAQDAKVSARVAAFRDLLDRLAPLIADGGLEVRVIKSRMVLQLSESALFESGDVNLTSRGKTLLDRVVDVLATIRDRNFQVGGHTDSAPPQRKARYANNWQVSSLRALNVMLYLIERGIAKARLSAAAYADTEAIADDSTPEGRKANRRVEIVLLPNADELPDLAALSELLANPPPPAPTQPATPSAQP